MRGEGKKEGREGIDGRERTLCTSERPLNGLAVITALTGRPLHNGNGRLEIIHIGLYRYNGRDRICALAQLQSYYSQPNENLLLH